MELLCGQNVRSMYMRRLKQTRNRIGISYIEQKACCEGHENPLVSETCRLLLSCSVDFVGRRQLLVSDSSRMIDIRHTLRASRCFPKGMR